MNFKATVKGIAASGGIRPDSHITACPVTAIKAGPVAHYFSRSRMGRPCADAHARNAAVAQRLRSETFRCAHRSVRHHERPLPWKASRLRDSSAGFCLEEAMGLRSGGSGVCGVRGRLLATGSRRYGRPSPATSLTGQHGNSATTVWWIAGSGGGQGLWPATALCKSSPHCRRNPNNPHAEKVRPHRARSLFSL